MTRKKKMSSLIFVKIVLQMIVVEYLVEVKYCNSFIHTAGNRQPFGTGLFIKFTFVSIGKLNLIFFYSILISNSFVLIRFYSQDLLHHGALFKKTSFQPKSYSIVFKYHANPFSGPPFFVQLNVNGAEVNCIPFSVYLANSLKFRISLGLFFFFG